MAGTSTWTTTVAGHDPVVADRAGPDDGRGPLHRQPGRRGPRGRGRPRGDDGAGALRGVDPVGPDGRRRTACPLTVVGVLNTVGSSSSSSTTSNPDDQRGRPDHHGRRAHLRRDVAQLGEPDPRPGPSSGDLTAAYQEADPDLLQLHGITTAAAADFTITVGAIAPLDGHLGRPDPDHPARRHRRASRSSSAASAS